MAFMNATVEIDKAGRIVVPKKVRDAMRLRAGDQLELRLEDNHMTLRSKHAAPKPTLQRVRGRLVYDSGLPISEAEVESALENAREERTAAILGIAAPSAR